MVPTKEHWENAWNGLDEAYAFDHFYGKTLEEAEDMIHDLPHYYREDFTYMPEIPFRFYFKAIKHCFISSRSRENTEAAFVFIRLIKYFVTTKAREYDWIKDDWESVVNVLNQLVDNLDSYYLQGDKDEIEWEVYQIITKHAENQAGINTSYNLHLIYNKEGIDTNLIVRAFIKFYKSKGVSFIKKEYLTVQQWRKNQFLFGIGITPITCFNLDGWEGEKEWVLITNNNFQNMENWELELSNDLKTIIECHNFSGTTSKHIVQRFENNQHLLETLQLDYNCKILEEIKDGVREEILGSITNSCGGIESYLAKDYYTLKTDSKRVNTEGEQYLIFKNDKKTFWSL